MVAIREVVAPELAPELAAKLDAELDLDRVRAVGIFTVVKSVPYPTFRSAEEEHERLKRTIGG